MSYIGQGLGQGKAERFIFTASGSETSVTLDDAGRGIAYTPGQVDVYLNGVKLVNGTDFTATSGSSITGLSALSASDVVEIVALDAFSPADTVSAASGGSFGDAVTITDASNNPLTLNRTTSDGDIQVFKKDGTTVGSIGTRTGRIKIGDGDCGLFFDDTNNRINPEGPDNTSANDAAIDLGGSTQRFKNLYLSGGVYLGGTGAANYLDDFEEGDWTPVLQTDGASPSVTYSRQIGKYTKIGGQVICVFRMTWTANSGGSGTFLLTGLPFTNNNSTVNNATGSLAATGIDFGNLGTTAAFELKGSSAAAYILVTRDNSGSWFNIVYSSFASSGEIRGTLIYKTDS